MNKSFACFCRQFSALVEGLAVGAHGYPRTTEDVDFLVGDEAFVKHASGLVTLKVPLIAVGNVRVDFLSVDESTGEGDQLRPALPCPLPGEPVPIVPLTALVYLKLKASPPSPGSAANNSRRLGRRG